MENTKRKLLTVREAAALIGLSAYRVRQMCNSGQLAYFKSGNRVLITKENLFQAVFGTEKNEKVQDDN